MEVAYQLRLPLYKLYEEMPYDELLMWFEYFNSRPIGWREDDRTVKLMQSFGAKVKPEQVFSSLAHMHELANKKIPVEGEISVSNLKRSSMFQKMNNAVGGAKLPF